MLLLRTALKNILGAGMRTWLNVSLLSFVLVIMVAYNALLDGWFDKARKESVEWEFAAGQIWADTYDPYDLLALPDAHASVPSPLMQLAEQKTITPVLVVPASVFPQGRMMNIQLKGMDPDQQIVKIATPEECDGDEIPVVIGKNMAKSMSLKKNDIVMARWRDKNGTFDARSLLIVDVFDSDDPNIDKGQIWMRLDQLQRLTLMENEASYFVCAKEVDTQSLLISNWKFKDVETLMKDILLIEEASRVKSLVVFVILLGLALLAVFDTQALSIFKRRKEIGTYVALGMRPNRVIALFTIEGSMYSLLAVLIALVWGSPLLYLFNEVGYSFPANTMSEVMFGDVIYPAFHISTIVSTILVLVIMSGIISYFPARKIARMNMVLALKGKIE